MDLEGAKLQLEQRATSVQQQLDLRTEELNTTKAALVVAEAHARHAEQQVECCIQRMGSSTPRPSRDLGLLSDLLTEAECAMVEKALISHVPAEHLHRLLLGLSPTEGDLLPWLGLAGCCKAAFDKAGGLLGMLWLCLCEVSNNTVASVMSHEQHAPVIRQCMSLSCRLRLFKARVRSSQKATVAVYPG